jgi:hypothetical protein
VLWGLCSAIRANRAVLCKEPIAVGLH